MNLSLGSLLATPWLLLVVSAVFGLLVGSHLNVVIHRVPLGLSTSKPRSACPNCNVTIGYRDLIPVLSWALLRGKCRACRAKISARYPAVEAVTAALTVLLTAHTGLTMWLPALLYLLFISVALFLIDLDCLRLPDAIVKPSWVILPVLLIPTVLSAPDPAHLLIRTALSTALWGGLFFTIWFATAGRGLGFGDVKLAPTLGLAAGVLGWGTSVVGLFSGFLFGSLIGVILVLRGSATRKTKVPYGPFLLTGFWFAVFAGPSIWHAYLNEMGLIG